VIFVVCFAVVTAWSLVACRHLEDLGRNNIIREEEAKSSVCESASYHGEGKEMLWVDTKHLVSIMERTIWIALAFKMGKKCIKECDLA
jgi:hypothetical protein